VTLRLGRTADQLQAVSQQKHNPNK